VRQLEAGKLHHERHGQLVARSDWAKRAAYVVIFCAIAVLVFQLLSR
jgi:hypothetical protein